MAGLVSVQGIVAEIDRRLRVSRCPPDTTIILPTSPGGVFLFGKVSAETPAAPSTPEAGQKAPVAQPRLVSCCVLVKGMHRSLIVVPRKWVGGALHVGFEVRSMNCYVQSSRYAIGMVGCANGDCLRHMWPARVLLLHLMEHVLFLNT